MHGLAPAPPGLDSGLTRLSAPTNSLSSWVSSVDCSGDRRGRRALPPPHRSSACLPLLGRLRDQHRNTSPRPPASRWTPSRARASCRVTTLGGVLVHHGRVGGGVTQVRLELSRGGSGMGCEGCSGVAQIVEAQIIPRPLRPIFASWWSGRVCACQSQRSRSARMATPARFELATQGLGNSL